MATELNQQTLVRKVTDAGYTHTYDGNKFEGQSTVMTGDVCFNQLPSGLNIHSTDATEQSDWQMSSEVLPVISINCLLEGEVSFALDDKHYRFSADNGPVIFMNLITRTQIFKRIFSAGIKVKKLNISVEPSWILTRCKEQKDADFVQHLFSLEPSVFCWPCSGSYQTIIQNLLRFSNNKSLEASLHTELLAFQLMLKCYKQLINLDVYGNVKPSRLSDICVALDDKYEKQVNALIEKSQPLTELSLTELSTELGASVSTLQRYFKSKHSVTLKQYIRNQKLELARRSLIFEQKSIGEAAYAAGYNHSSNFIKAFKSHFSMTPAELIKHYKSGM